MSWGFILKPGEDRRVPGEDNKPNMDAVSHAWGPRAWDIGVIRVIWSSAFKNNLLHLEL